MTELPPPPITHVVLPPRQSGRLVWVALVALALLIGAKADELWSLDPSVSTPATTSPGDARTSSSTAPDPYPTINVVIQFPTTTPQPTMENWARTPTPTPIAHFCTLTPAPGVVCQIPDFRTPVPPTPYPPCNDLILTPENDDLICRWPDATPTPWSPLPNE